MRPRATLGALACSPLTVLLLADTLSPWLPTRRNRVHVTGDVSRPHAAASASGLYHYASDYLPCSQGSGIATSWTLDNEVRQTALHPSVRRCALIFLSFSLLLASEFINLPQAQLFDWWQIPPSTAVLPRRMALRQRLGVIVASRWYEYGYLTVVATNAVYIFALASFGHSLGDRYEGKGIG